MATTQLHGKEQVRSNTLDLGRLEIDFLKSSKWNPNSGSAVPGTLTGIPNPVENLDVANKAYVDSAVSGSSTIGVGAAEDGSYTDGLFADFVPSTSVGTAVDRFNEVLKALAPAPAPNLTTAVSGTSGVAGKLSFDAAHAIAGVTPHTSQLINSAYSVSGNVRGIINTTTAVTATLASNVVPSYANSRPYPNNAFGDADAGLLHLEINGVIVQSVDLTSFVSGNSFNANGSGFTLSAATSVKFDNGNPLDLFKYRTGTVNISAASMVSGYNVVKVKHEYSAGTYRDSNTTSWIVDTDATATSYGTGVLGSLTMTGTKYLSGVKYHTAGTANYGITIHNAYKNTYSSSASAITFNGNNCAIASMALSAMSAYTDDVVLSGKTASINTTRLLNASIAVSTSTLRTVQSTITSGSASIGNILLDNTSDDSTSINETFNGESYRVHTGVVLTDIAYGAGGASASSYTWDSAQSLIDGNVNHNTGLLISNGELTYPTNTTHIGTIVSGNFSAANNGYAGNVNYSLASGNREYLRYFYTATAKSNFRLNVTATGTTFVSVATGASGNNLTFEVLAPNTTVNSGGSVVWKDGVVAHSGNDTDVGCYAGTFGNSQPTNWGMTLGAKNTSTSGKVIVVKITAGSGWTGKISNIALTWL
jgi:hypothetical protein